MMPLLINENSSLEEGRPSPLGTAPLQCSYNLFQEPWWLDAVAPGAWAEVTVRKGEEVVARLPYILKQRMGLRVTTQPKLTPNLGPWMRATGAKYANRLGDEKNMLNALIEQLPSADLFRQNFAPQVTSWLPFHWAGYQVSVSCTYRIPNLRDLESVWENCLSNIRGYVLKAKKTLTVRDDLSMDRLMEVTEMTFRRQNCAQPFSRELVSRIDEACGTRQCRKALFAEDGQGRIHAVAYIVWDSEAAYYLLSGADPDLRNSGASSLLLWEAIRYASTVTKAFDFEGSRIEPIERFFRAFGGQQIPYYCVKKTGRRMRALLGLHNFTAALTGFEIASLKGL